MAEFTRPRSVIFSSKGAVKGKRTLDSGMGKKEKKINTQLLRGVGGTRSIICIVTEYAQLIDKKKKCNRRINEIPHY